MQTRGSCLYALAAIVSKIQERCPLKHAFFKALKCLDPVSMALGGTAQFKTVTSKLVQAKRFSVDVGDAAEERYQKFGR